MMLAEETNEKVLLRVCGQENNIETPVGRQADGDSRNVVEMSKRQDGHGGHGPGYRMRSIIQMSVEGRSCS
jgi:hypothetical protein